MSKVRNTDGPVMPREGFGLHEPVAPPRDPPPHGGSVFTPGTQRSSPAVVLLIVAGVSTLVGLFFAVPAGILAILGVVNQRESPARSAKFTRWGWIVYVVGGALMLLAGVALMVVAGYAASGNN